MFLNTLFGNNDIVTLVEMLVRKMEEFRVFPEDNGTIINAIPPCCGKVIKFHGSIFS
jgi:hypothetical protein